MTLDHPNLLPLKMLATDPTINGVYLMQRVEIQFEYEDNQTEGDEPLTHNPELTTMALADNLEM